MEKNEDPIVKGFKQMRKIWMATIFFVIAMGVGSMWLGCHIAAVSGRTIVLSTGEVLKAVAAEREANLPVEARDHLRMFHRLVFDLGPDEKAIRASIGQALYLADGSAKKLYDDWVEKGWIGGLVSGNITQEVRLDSIAVDFGAEPYAFRCIGMEVLTRATSVTTRTLVTRGFLRNVRRSDNNPHGFLIERFEIVENKEVKVVGR
jgi:conjugative transposon TraK protein